MGIDSDRKRTVILTGIHRSGTTLACQLLSALPDVVALDEPMQVIRFKGIPLGGVDTFLDDFIQKTRISLVTEGKAFSKHVDGKLTDNHHYNLFSDNGLRSPREEFGEIGIEKPLRDDFLLVIKHNAAFTALLNHLVSGYSCFGIIRNPLAILASWQTVDMHINESHIPVAESLDAGLRQSLALLDDRLDRQLHILDWWFGRLGKELPSASIIRYEDIIETGGRCLEVITPAASHLKEELLSRNSNPLYHRDFIATGERLLSSRGNYWNFYSRAEVESLMNNWLNDIENTARNRFGIYAIPESSRHRPVVRKILAGDVHEPDTLEFIRNNCAKGDVVHAGTYFGDFLPGISSGMSEGARVWAFEPNTENYHCAERTIRLNKLENVILRNAGLGVSSASGKLLIQGIDGTSLGGASRIGNPDDEGKLEEIRIVSIDEVIPEDRKISIIQLDVEGYEKNALAGALKLIARCKPILILEDNSGAADTVWFAENILSMGYDMTGKVHNNAIFETKRRID